MKEHVTASAPGSLMLLGEHAVLHGRRCLVTAVTPRMRVSLRKRADRNVVVKSALGTHRTTLDRVRAEPPFEFLLTAVAEHAGHLDAGIEVTVESMFRADVGLGSSAAVTVASHAALCAARGREMAPGDLFDLALKTVRAVQGLGSGADVAAAVWGGTVLYRAEPREVEALEAACPLTVVYSGGKVPTPVVVGQVERARERHPELFEGIYDLMDRAVGQAAEAVQGQDWKKLGAILDINQGLMEAIGVSDGRLAERVYALREQDGIFGAKISGAGLGDCVIGLGHMPRDAFRYDVLQADASREGVHIDEASGG